MPPIETQISDFLEPFFRDEDSRFPIITKAIKDSPSLRRINWAGNSFNFTTNLVETIVTWDGRETLIQLLKSLKFDVGVEKQNQIDNLILVLRDESGNILPDTSQQPEKVIDDKSNKRSRQSRQPIIFAFLIVVFIAIVIFLIPKSTFIIDRFAQVTPSETPTMTPTPSETPTPVPIIKTVMRDVNVFVSPSSGIGTHRVYHAQWVIVNAICRISGEQWYKISFENALSSNREMVSGWIRERDTEFLVSDDIPEDIMIQCP